MRTVIDATLYVVKGPKGPYYAIRENDSGLVVTERTEQAAAALANEKDMIVVDRREISHEELVKILAHNDSNQIETFSGGPVTSSLGFVDA
jgi:hypothetical protein